MKSHYNVVPRFPKTPHIPYYPNVADDDDIVANRVDVEPLFDHANQIYVEEKIDGASVGIAVIDGSPVIRNRDNFLRKGYMRKRKDTTAKMQFRPIWNWYYEHSELFKTLYGYVGPVTVYGEWMLAQHGIYYDSLPSYFIAYDLFCHTMKRFLQTSIVRGSLQASGFTVPPLIHAGQVPFYEKLSQWAREKSAYSSDQLREGLYFKVHNPKTDTLHRFKMVREGFVRGKLWNNEEFNKNQLLGN